MKTYAITIKPLTGFGTPLKGDTLFGHICWQAVYNYNQDNKKLFGKSLDDLLSDYERNPFIVVSSAYPKIKDGYALKRPDMPLDMLFDFSNMDKAKIIKKRKDLKGKRWMLVGSNNRISSLKAADIYLNDKELFEKLSIEMPFELQRQMRKMDIKSIIVEFTQPHNTINRLTGTTGEGQFAPYAVDQMVYMPDIELVIFTGIRDDISIEDVITAMQMIGDTGFGKDASIGLGRFKVVRYTEINLKAVASETPNACYTLSPSVPQKDTFEKIYFTPFVRFGRHGDVLAKSGKPFKNPVIMADEGAVLIPKSKEVFDKPYIGTAIFKISKAESKAVTQGYSLYIPVGVEV